MMVVVEGDTDLPYVRKLVEETGLAVTSQVDAGGKGSIDRDLKQYNSIARSMPVLVLRDLDRDAACAAAFIDKLKFRRARWFRFRLVVRALESWVLADSHGLSKFIEVEEKWFPADPDSERDPTLSLLKIAERSPARIRKKLLPERGSATMVGPLYEATLIEFGEREWSAARASKRSDSLRRARTALRSLANDWNAFTHQT